MRQLHQNKLFNGDMCEQDFDSSDKIVDHINHVDHINNDKNSQS